MIVGLTGYARSGKDTAAAALVEDGWTRVAFADRLKAAALALDPIVGLNGGAHPDGHVRLSHIVHGRGWEAAKELTEVRATLQRLGVAMRDHVHPDVWVRAALADADSFGNTVITDVRFPNEADAILAMGGMVVRISRPGVEAVNPHVSETALADRAFPTVLNDGDIDHLHLGIRTMLETVR